MTSHGALRIDRKFDTDKIIIKIQFDKVIINVNEEYHGQNANDFLRNKFNIKYSWIKWKSKLLLNYKDRVFMD